MTQTSILTPRLALDKGFLRIKPTRIEIDRFRDGLVRLFDRVNDNESEEYHKNLVLEFLNDTYYKSAHFINVKGRNDLVIHNGIASESSVGVIFEVKKPSNKNEMMTLDHLNTKAFHELVLYYLQERIEHKNLEIKHLIITNVDEWFIFDAAVFDRLFAQNKDFLRQFNEYKGKRLVSEKTDLFYTEIAKPFIAEIEEIELTHFNLRGYESIVRAADKENDVELIPLYKIFSPEHLLKLPFANDSNTLDRSFYDELLHIIGLTETQTNKKHIIKRKKESEQNLGSILEDTIFQLQGLDKINRLEQPNQYGNTPQEQLFNVSLELSLTWINRILFLKLLEAQLVAYHKGDKSYSFLNFEKIKNYGDLNSLFFHVLAKKPDERHKGVRKIFENIPYLNSSLFEPTELEQKTIVISNLNDKRTIPIFALTVLRDHQEKKRTGKISTLEYLFEFLDAYDFGSDVSSKIQAAKRPLINAAVLGLIFEKINGYKDGSFFTPGYITMYMCRETIRKAVIQKFNEVKKWNCSSIEDIYNKITNIQEANGIVNSIKICDPAVGSGHFLVSALNEIIAVKSDLKILQDRTGKRLKEYHVEVVNDELIITDEDGEIFEYHPSSPESQRVQETFFHEKQAIIENSLFGADINSNSVQICRLRLWIELLKNAYYKNATELETLPNLDINIKCGNSLVSRFALNADLSRTLEKHEWTIDRYRSAVDNYRNAKDREEKREMERLITNIKSDFHKETIWSIPEEEQREKLLGELYRITNQEQFGETVDEDKRRKKELQLNERVVNLDTKIAEIKSSNIFENAFEWRFEFPEVLDDHGDFLGFDIVIGNPPYGTNTDNYIKLFEKNYPKTSHGFKDIYKYFF